MMQIIASVFIQNSSLVLPKKFEVLTASARLRVPPRASFGMVCGGWCVVLPYICVVRRMAGV